MPLIVGGGPAGAAAAITLAEAGLRPVIVERTPAPSDMLCGGFLSWNSVRLLKQYGVDPFALGGHAVGLARLFTKRRMVELALPNLSAGLSRRTLDKALLDRATVAGADIRRGIAVRAIEDGTVRYADGTSQTPAHLILATGKHDVRGLMRPVKSKDATIGLRWRFQSDKALINALSGAIELHLFNHGYAGLILQEDGFANLCLAVRQSAFATAGQRPSALLATMLDDMPVLARRLSGVVPGDAQAIANIPYGWSARDDAAPLYRVGDQVGVIPSLAGEGVGIALATGAAAAHAILSAIPPRDYQRRCTGRISAPIRAASGLWSLAERPYIAEAALSLLAKLPGAASFAMRATRVNADILARRHYS